MTCRNKLFFHSLCQFGAKTCLCAGRRSCYVRGVVRMPLGAQGRNSMDAASWNSLQSLLSHWLRHLLLCFSYCDYAVRQLRGKLPALMGRMSHQALQGRQTGWHTVLPARRLAMQLLPKARSWNQLQSSGRSRNMKVDIIHCAIPLVCLSCSLLVGLLCLVQSCAWNWWKWIADHLCGQSYQKDQCMLLSSEPRVWLQQSHSVFCLHLALISDPWAEWFAPFAGNNKKKKHKKKPKVWPISTQGRMHAVSQAV